MSEIKQTYQEYVLKNDEKVNLSLSFGKLNILKKLNFDLYERFNRVLYGKSEDILDLVTRVYVAYWCANYNGTTELYKEEDFFDLVEFDALELKRVFTALTQPKKK